jgi:DNA-directed RNA polymerase specialized sigma24 family protein
MSDVTHLLNAITHGNAQAAGELLPLVYEELRRLATRRLAREAPGQTLDATALVHEAYLRLVGADADPHWDGHAHFFAAAAEAMRRILIDNARRKQTVKHGGGRRRVDLDEEKLAELDAKKAELVKLRFFAGLTIPEAAAVLDISVPTAERYWTFAKVWLYAELNDS